MNTRFINSIRTLFADRAILAFALAIFVLGVGYITYVMISLQPSELQVAAHYSAFGDTNYYRNKWYYLLSFAVFGLIFIIGHIGLLVKLASRDLRPLAFAFGYLSLAMVPLLFILTYSVLGIAF